MMIRYLLAGLALLACAPPPPAPPPQACPDPRIELRHAVAECEVANGPGQFRFAVTSFGDGIWHLDCVPHREMLPPGPKVKIPKTPRLARTP